MFGGARRAVAVVGCVVALGSVVGCSDDADEPEASPRRCAVVQAGELSEIVDAEVELLAPVEGSSACTFTSEDGAVEVRTSVEGPVEAGSLLLLLTTPEEVPDLGDEAYVATVNTPLDAQLLVRRAGSMLRIDVGIDDATNAERIEAAEAIGRAGLPNVPEMAVVTPTGARGEAACEPFEVPAVEELIGGQTSLTPVAPAGSCQLAAPALNLTVTVSVLVERGANTAQLDGFVAAIDTEQALTIGEAPAYWIPSTAGEEQGGQLDLLADGRILQVSVVGLDLEEGEARALAQGIAAVALDPEG